MENELLKSFGQNLKEYRKKSGLSQEGLALECGLDRTYISGIERGKRNVSLINIFKIAQTLRIDPCCLLKFEVNKDA